MTTYFKRLRMLAATVALWTMRDQTSMLDLLIGADMASFAQYMTLEFLSEPISAEELSRLICDMLHGYSKSIPEFIMDEVHELIPEYKEHRHD